MVLRPSGHSIYNVSQPQARKQNDTNGAPYSLLCTVLKTTVYMAGATRPLMPLTVSWK